MARTPYRPTVAAFSWSTYATPKVTVKAVFMAQPFLTFALPDQQHKGEVISVMAQPIIQRVTALMHQLLKLWTYGGNICFFYASGRRQPIHWIYSRQALENQSI